MLKVHRTVTMFKFKIAPSYSAIDLSDGDTSCHVREATSNGENYLVYLNHALKSTDRLRIDLNPVSGDELPEGQELSIFLSNCPTLEALRTKCCFDGKP